MYKFKKKISQGGFGKIYLAKNVNTGQEVIVKMNAEAEMNDSEFKILKHMSDKNEPGFPKVYSSGVFSTQPYIILERLGASLKDIMVRRKRHFSIKCTMTIGIHLVDLLEKFHSQGFIHCDLKPDNVLVGHTSSKQLFLIDFGIS
jgi:serine/threonine protein kinase